MPLRTVVVPVYVTALPVSVVVALPAWVREPLPLIRGRARGLAVLPRISEPLFTTL